MASAVPAQQCSQRRAAHAGRRRARRGGNVSGRAARLLEQNLRAVLVHTRWLEGTGADASDLCVVGWVRLDADPLPGMLGL